MSDNKKPCPRSQSGALCELETRVLWNDLRSQLQHEDGLVNQRLAWMLAFNGFLFAVVGLSLFKEIPGHPGTGGFQLRADQLVALRIVVSLAGIGTAIAAFLGTLAAFRTIRLLVEKYRKHPAGSSARNICRYPSGETGPSNLGMASGLLFPSLLLGIWSFVLLGQIPGIGDVVGISVVAVVLAFVSFLLGFFYVRIGREESDY